MRKIDGWEGYTLQISLSDVEMREIGAIKIIAQMEEEVEQIAAGYPKHRHGSEGDDANQEEVYIPIEGSATLVADDESVELRQGMMVRVGPEQLRQILPGPDGLRMVALGGVPGTFAHSPWTELGGPLPVSG